MNEQPTLFLDPNLERSAFFNDKIGATEPIRFDGPDYDPTRDNARLTGQILRIFECMKDEQWRTLAQIEAITGDPQASISAQLRHLRKKRFGGHTVNKRHLGNGLYEMQLIVSVSLAA